MAKPKMVSKRRRACDCFHYFVSGCDGSKKCGMFITLNLGGEEVRVHMTRACNGVCHEWTKSEGELT